MGNPTQQTYTSLDKAYNYFNTKLFNDSLPKCLITMQRHKGARGFFVGSRFENLTDKTDITDEIALNPSTFKDRETKEIVSTLVHEMVHLWQSHHGKPSRTGYHNKQWAEHMQGVGLMPTSTGQANGKLTGQKVTHMIITGGLFDVVATEFFKTNAIELYQDINMGTTIAKKKKAESKTKFTCPECDQNAWAKITANLVCGDCEVTMQKEE